MFSTVIYFVKTSKIFLVIGIMAGLYLFLKSIYNNDLHLTVLVSAQSHIILFGPVIMITLSQSFWFFPRPEIDHEIYKPLFSSCKTYSET